RRPYRSGIRPCRPGRSAGGQAAREAHHPALALRRERPGTGRAPDRRPYQAGRDEEGRHTRRYRSRRKCLRTDRPLDPGAVQGAWPERHGLGGAAPSDIRRNWQKRRNRLFCRQGAKPADARRRAPAATFRLRRRTLRPRASCVMNERVPGEAAEVRDGTRSRTVPLARGLSIKLLVLTVLFVMIAEVLIFLPSIADFKLRWLEERLGTAAAVSVVLVQEDAGSLPRTLQDDVLRAIGAKAIAVRDSGVSRLLVIAEMPPEVDEHIDLAHTGPVVALTGALDTLFFGGQRMLRVFGKVGESASEFELVIPDNRLRAAMLVYSRNV